MPPDAERRPGGGPGPALEIIQDEEIAPKSTPGVLQRTLVEQWDAAHAAVFERRLELARIAGRATANPCRCTCDWCQYGSRPRLSLSRRVIGAELAAGGAW
jgi:hypothetical protein